MKVQDLTGADLDYWVAKAEGLPAHPGLGRYVVAAPIDTRWAHEFKFSTDWSDGGPIIEREAEPIDNHGAGGLWRAQGAWKCQLKADGWVCEGPTPLIAACRAYVASKFGPEVPDVPDVEG